MENVIECASCYDRIENGNHHSFVVAMNGHIARFFACSPRCYCRLFKIHAKQIALYENGRIDYKKWQLAKELLRYFKDAEGWEL